ncbi:MAG: IPTL-CTERM sorting domain-containing protein [Pseudomonadota bacterium]
MKLVRLCLCIVICHAFFVGFSPPVHAGTTTIEVRTEGLGDIVRDTSETNLNGAMVWNGSIWVVNDTWAHMFFAVVASGLRLKNYDDPQYYSGTSPLGVIATYGNYTVTRTIYSYTKEAVTGTDFIYQAVEYSIHDNVTGHEIILRSRGTGNETSQPSFDIYIQDDLPTGVQTTAFRGDPVWYTYTGMTPAQAVNQTDEAAFRTGHLPGAMATQSTPEGWYFLDIGGGSDMGPAGTGKSFEFHTGTLLPADVATRNLGSSFPIDFNLKYMDDSGDLQMLHFEPAILSEASAFESVPTLNQWGMIMLTLVLGIAAARLKRRLPPGTGSPV